MTDAVALNPAEAAAENVRQRIYCCIDEGKPFLIEAGAGAGKTFSLINALKYLIEKKVGNCSIATSASRASRTRTLLTTKSKLAPIATPRFNLIRFIHFAGRRSAHSSPHCGSISQRSPTGQSDWKRPAASVNDRSTTISGIRASRRAGFSCTTTMCWR